MYLVQISDFHIVSEVDTGKKIPILDNLIGAIKAKIPERSIILVCICGDIIDGKDISNEDKVLNYRWAKIVLDHFIKELKDQYDLRFGICPGNHDLCEGGTNFHDFLAFSQQYVKEMSGLDEDSINYQLSFPDENVDVIFLDSLATRKHDFGALNLGDLKNIFSKLNKSTSKIIVMHHSLISMYDNDDSPLRNVGEFLKIIKDENVIAILHGHTHGIDGFLIGTYQCSLIGVGSLFSRNNPNVNSQLNIINVEHGFITKALNYIYRADGGVAVENVVENKINLSPARSNSFTGQSFSEIYDQLCKAIIKNPNKQLNNVNIHGCFMYDQFYSDIMDKFGKSRDELRFEYYKLAEIWEAVERPSELYFNHGEKFAVFIDNKIESGIKYIIATLEDNPTSNSAVLSSCCMADIKDKKCNNFLPSLLIIQFGFNNDSRSKLLITIYLRALEVSRFLKINICEILFFANEIHKKWHFSEIELNINTFRAHCRENFGCFFKSDIDEMADVDEKENTNSLYQLLQYKQYDDIIRLLENKKSYSETVVISKGIVALKNSVKSVIDGWNKYGIPSEKELTSYKNILDILSNLVSSYEELKEINNRTSIVTSEVDIVQKKINKKLAELVEAFYQLNRR